jgi:hypothetical protein
VVSVATDPVEPNRVYAAVGTYTNGWDPNNGAVLYSDDYGETWGAAELPFHQGGNMPGRGMGERLMIDPSDNATLYLGAPSGNGLWKSTNHGRDWSKVDSFPNTGDFVIAPGDPYLGDSVGVIWIEFNPQDDLVYVGVADPDNPIYVSDDDGATWAPLAGASQLGSTDGYDNIPKQAAYDEASGYLFVITSWDPGPYNGSPNESGSERGGSVWRHDSGDGSWTEIHPGPNGTAYEGFGFGGLTLDKQSPGTLMVTSVNAWWPDETTFRSKDYGETWTQSWSMDGWPNRVDRYTIDHSSVGWLDWGVTNPGEAQIRPMYGWMIDSMAIDPHDSDRYMYGTGATIYGSTDLTNWDANQTFTLKPMIHGLEETAVLDLAAPPGGPILYSGLGDIGGFVHTDLDSVPSAFYNSPHHSNTTSLDFAELNPSVVVRVGNGGDDSRIGISSNSGGSWWAGQTPGGVTDSGTVAITANASAIVWSPGGIGPRRSTDYGSSWTQVTGLPSGARVESDRADANRVYGYAGGTFYYSVDGGSTFTASSYSGFPDEGGVRFAAVPGNAGHVWLTGGDEEASSYGMWRSTDGGATWSQVGGLDAADTVGFGKAAPGHSYPAIYTSASYQGQRGIYRSVDQGASWTRINDDDHQWGWTGDAIAGDPDVFGRVFVGTNGRGVIVGTSSGFEGGDPNETPSESESPSETPSEEPSETPSEDPTTTSPPGECTVQWSRPSDWPGGHQGSATITNTSGSSSSSWTIQWTFAHGEQVTNLWSGRFQQNGASVTVTPESWNGALAPGGSATIGYLASHNNQITALEPTCTLS